MVTVDKEFEEWLKEQDASKDIHIEDYLYEGLQEQEESMTNLKIEIVITNKGIQSIKEIPVNELDEFLS